MAPGSSFADLSGTNLVHKNQVKFKTGDLKTVTIRWHWLVTGAFATLQGMPLTVLGSFTPQSPLFCPMVNYNIQSMPLSNIGSIVLTANFIIGFTDNMAAFSQAASLGTAIVDLVAVQENSTSAARESKFMNFDPYGFHLPIGKTVYIIGGSNLSIGQQGVYDGATTLYLLETYE